MKRYIKVISLLLIVLVSCSILTSCGFNGAFRQGYFRTGGTLFCNYKLKKKRYNEGEDVKIELYYGIGKDEYRHLLPSEDGRTEPVCVAIYLSAGGFCEDTAEDYMNFDSKYFSYAKSVSIKAMQSGYFDVTEKNWVFTRRYKYNHHETFTIPYEMFCENFSFLYIYVSIVCYDNEDGVYILKNYAHNIIGYKRKNGKLILSNSGVN